MNQPLTPEQTKSAYQRVCGKCQLPIHSAEVGIRHYGLFEAHSEHRCIELLKLDANEKAAQIAAMQAALAIIAKRTCGSDCKNRHVNDNKDLPKIPRTSWCAKCLVDSLSDDIERGKELLDKERQLTTAWEADSARQDECYKSGYNDGVQAGSQRQAVEIEELRRLLAATVSTVSRRTDAMIEAYNAVPVEGDDETPAAMKEKP